MKRVLVFNPFGIGDVLFTTPLIRNLKEKIKEVSVQYLCNRRVYPLIRHNEFLDKAHVFEKDQWRARLRESKAGFLKDFLGFRAALKKERFDAVFDCSLNSQYGFFFKSLGIKKRLGFNYKRRGRFLTHKIDIPGGYSQKHAARYYLSLLEFLDVKPRDCGFDLSLPCAARARAGEIIREHGLGEGDFLVAMCPGSGDSWQATAEYKRWPWEKFLSLAQRLQKEMKAKIVLFGSGAEKDVCGSVYNGLSGAVDLCGRLKLDEFCAVMDSCGLVITNDGGPLHIAQALGKKTVVFFGPVDEKVYGPYPGSDNCRIFTADVSCRPCYKSFRFNGCDNNKRCLTRIPEEEVFEAIRGWIAGE